MLAMILDYSEMCPIEEGLVDYMIKIEKLKVMLASNDSGDKMQ